MWTPRRLLLLLLAFLAMAGIYAVYAYFLGWLDGLPLLPVSKLPDPSKPPLEFQRNDVSPTEQRLLEAFGPDAAECSSVYPTKLEFRNGDTSVVLAAGPFPLQPGAKTISLVPFSMAVFGKPKPEHLRQRGETVEIHTFHADKAILEFDRPISNAQDVSKAKLVRMELVSDPEDALPDPRRGMVHITNNQQSTDPNHLIVMRTPGPVFYRDAKALGVSDGGPDVWTDAAVEIVDRKNLPRGYGQPSPMTASEPRGGDYRDSQVVREILEGRRLPPPTLTGVGLKLYFEPETTTPTSQPPSRKGNGPSGLKRLELREKVLINLWVDEDTRLSADGRANSGARNPLNAAEPPAASSALVGSILEGHLAARLARKALLQIETLGPFSFDAVTNTARFDVIAQANPDVPNDVQVCRVLARGGQQNLYTQVLELEFTGAPGGDAAPGGKTSSASPTFRRLHAWTQDPRKFVTLTMSSVESGPSARPTPGGAASAAQAAEEDQLVAFAEDLVYDQAAEQTILTGAPLYLLRERHILTAGEPRPKRPGQLILQSGGNRPATATVLGPGRIELHDPAAKANTIHATWKTSLTHLQEKMNGRDVDLLTFTDEASFTDTQAGYQLKGNILKLWLQAAHPSSLRGTHESPGAPQPQRLQALGEVSAQSKELIIENADQVNVIIRDAPASAPLPSAPAGRSSTPAATDKTPAASSPPASRPSADPLTETPRPPLKVSARLVDAFVLRSPMPTIPQNTNKDPASPTRAGQVKYEIQTVRCEDQVIVHQPPQDPGKPRGLDIRGQTLDIKQSLAGSVLTVTGTEDKPGEVHYERLSIIGPNILLDQVHNRASVQGRGVLQMPSSSDLNGNPLNTAEDVKVFWRDGMDFAGATKNAEFRGKVVAMQGESWVTSHRMVVGFDRPIYFNQRRSADPGRMGHGASENPKIESVRCEPAPADLGEDGRRYARVWFNEIHRDPATRAVLKSQLVEAEELTLQAHPKSSEPLTTVQAHGQGFVRLWQPGQKDLASDGIKSPGRGNDPKAAQEMKLTVVKYSGRMNVEDRKIFQKAVFTDHIEVVHFPTEDPNTHFELHRLPPGSVILKCQETLTATNYRPPGGPVQQGMTAKGNAYIRTDEYEGWGEEIEYDGRLIILKGGKKSPARIMSRFKNTENSGREIKLDRLTNRYELVDGVSGQIAAPPKQ